MKFKLLHQTFLLLASLGVHGHGPGGGKPLEGSPEAQGPRVKTALGWIEGTYKKTEPGAKKFASYEGIPYAVPPYDGLRFKPPVKHDNFYRPHEPLMATKPGAECPQMENGEYKGSEDCLYLNVFTPQLDSIGHVDYPVMVWIHGGAFQMGSASSEHYGPERLLEKEVVVVSINYRLGPLGFLTTGDHAAPPNVGILDQQLALRWVKDHITSFGGNPNKVTIFGESAGGISVMAHIASPYSRGLFQQAISMSGVWGEIPFLHKSKKPSAYALDLATKVGCNVSPDLSSDIAGCLRSKSPEQLIKQAAASRLFSFLPEPFTPTWDGYMEAPVLPEPLHEVWNNPSPSSVVPLMIGGNKDEGILLLLEFLKDQSKLSKLNEEFATEGPALLLGVDPVEDPWLRDEGETATAEILRSNYLGEDTDFKPENQKEMIDLLSDVHILGPTDYTVRKLTKSKIPLYYYRYQHQGSLSLPMLLGIKDVLGVSHFDELFLLFKFSSLDDLALKTEEDVLVSEKLVTLWTNFAKTGKPTEDDSWKPVTEESLEYAVLDASPLRMEYSETLAKRWKDVTSMFELARKSRALSKEQHPKLEAMRQERDELYQKDIEAKEDEIDTEEDTASHAKMDEKAEEKIIEDYEFGEVEESDEGEEFDPLKEMMKLVEMEEREGKEFKDHLRALNVDLKELGLDDEGGWGHDEL